MDFLVIRMERQRTRRLEGALRLPRLGVEGQPLLFVDALQPHLVDVLAGDCDKRRRRGRLHVRVGELQVGDANGVVGVQRERSILLVIHAVALERAGNLQLMTVAGHRRVNSGDAFERLLEETGQFRQPRGVGVHNEIRLTAVA